MKIRPAQINDTTGIFKLYHDTAAIPGGLARFQHEINLNYIDSFLQASLDRGLSLIAENKHQILGEIHAYSPGIAVFKHVWSDLTICVHPQAQGQQIGRKLFTAFLSRIETDYPHISRVELIARESNQKAIRFYQSLGFQIEGALKGRIYNPDTGLESDIPMAWIREHAP